MGHYSDIAGQLNDMDSACTQIEEQLKGVRSHTDLDVMKKINANYTEIVHGDGWLKVEGPQLAKITFGTTVVTYLGGKGEFITPGSLGVFLLCENKRIAGVSNAHVLGHKYERVHGAKIDRINGLKLEQKNSTSKETGATGKVQDDSRGINQVGKWAEKGALQKWEVRTVKEFKDSVEEEAAQLEEKITALQAEITKWKENCARFKGTIDKYEHKGTDHVIEASNSITVRGDSVTLKGSSGQISIDQGKLDTGGNNIECKGGVKVTVDGITKVG